MLATAGDVELSISAFLGHQAFFPPTLKSERFFTAVFLRSNISNHFGGNFIQTVGELFFFICFSLVFSIIHWAFWTLLSVHHIYSYSPRIGVWRTWSQRENQSDRNYVARWLINYHLPGVVWKIAISLGRQSTFFLTNSRMSLHKGPCNRESVSRLCGSFWEHDALVLSSTDGWCLFTCSQPVPLHTLR